MSSEKFSFNVLKENNSARLGKIITHRGQVDTPAFMPIGTLGTIKAVFIDYKKLISIPIFCPSCYPYMNVSIWF